MKIQTQVLTLLIGCVSGLSFNIVINQSAVAQTAAQRQRIKALGLPLVLPSYKPSGYRFTGFTIEKWPSDLDGYDKNDPHKNYNYIASYTGPNSCEFNVSTGPGVGDPLRSKDYNLGTTVFSSSIISQILVERPYSVSFIGQLPHRVLYFTGFCKSKNFSVEEGKKIVRSLRKIQEN